MQVEVKAQICAELNIMTEALSDTYLGLPSMIGSDRSDSFTYLVERVVNRLKGWKEKLLSFGGKEILLKAIIQSILVLLCLFLKSPRRCAKKSLMSCLPSVGRYRGRK